MFDLTRPNQRQHVLATALRQSHVWSARLLAPFFSGCHPRQLGPLHNRLMKRPTMMVKRIRQCDVARLDEIGQFRLMTAELLQRRCFAGSNLAAAESWLKRQRSARLLTTEPLDARRVYFHLTSTAVKRLREQQRSVSRAAARPLKPMTKIQRYALLLYCTPQEGTLRHPYRPSQDAAAFPEVAKYIASGKADPLRNKLFYREGETIGWLLLDRGWPRALDRKVKPKAVSLSRWGSLWRRMTVAFEVTGEVQETDGMVEIQVKPVPCSETCSASCECHFSLFDGAEGPFPLRIGASQRVMYLGNLSQLLAESKRIQAQIARLQASQNGDDSEPSADGVDSNTGGSTSQHTGTNDLADINEPRTYRQ